MDSIKTYLSQVRMCLQGDKSKQALNEYLLQSAIDLLFEKFAGRFSPSNSWKVLCFSWEDDKENERMNGHVLSTYNLHIFLLLYVAMERIVERNDPAAWKAIIEEAEEK
jgi:hypothetical protein